MSETLQSLSDETLSEYDRLREDAISLKLKRWTLFELIGDDRKAWLQGQVTNDLRSFVPGSSAGCCICKSTGQLEAIVDAWALTDRFCLVCQDEEADALTRRVSEMVILEDVSLVNVSSDFIGLSIQGPRATAKLSEILELPNMDCGIAAVGEDHVRLFRSDRTGSGGWDLWIPVSAEAFAERLILEIGTLGQEGYEIARIEAGIPRAGIDYDKRTLPPELGSKFEARHISYTKGCYTGQEILMRMHSRGHTNRTWVGLQVSEMPTIGSVVSHRVRGEVGHVTSAVFSPDYGPIALAWVRREVADPGSELSIQEKAASFNAEVRPLPFFGGV